MIKALNCHSVDVYLPFVSHVRVVGDPEVIVRSRVARRGAKRAARFWELLFHFDKKASASGRASFAVFKIAAGGNLAISVRTMGWSRLHTLPQVVGRNLEDSYGVTKRLRSFA